MSILEDTAAALGLTAQDTEVIRRVGTELRPHMGDLVAAFYANPTVSGFFDGVDQETRKRLSLRQEEHWNALFSARLDAAYEARVRAVAQAHRRIGLTTDRYVLAYYVMRDLIAIRLADRFAGEPGRLNGALLALQKIVALDVVLTLRVYNAAELDL